MNLKHIFIFFSTISLFLSVAWAAEVSSPDIKSPETNMAQSLQEEEISKLPLININTADVATLQEVHGIGEKKAEAIILYRNEHGNFLSIEGLLNVRGVGQAFLDKIKNEITVGNE